MEHIIHPQKGKTRRYGSYENKEACWEDNKPRYNECESLKPHNSEEGYSKRNCSILDKIFKNMTETTITKKVRTSPNTFETQHTAHDFETTFLNFYDVKSRDNIKTDTRDNGNLNIYMKILKGKPKKHYYSSESFPSKKSILSKGKMLVRNNYSRKKLGIELTEERYDQIFPKDIHSVINNGDIKKKSELINALDQCIQSRIEFRGKCILPCGLKDTHEEGTNHVNFLEKLSVLLAYIRQ